MSCYLCGLYSLRQEGQTGHTDIREGLSLQGSLAEDSSRLLCLAVRLEKSVPGRGAWWWGDMCCRRGWTQRCDKHDEGRIPPKCGTGRGLQGEGGSQSWPGNTSYVWGALVGAAAVVLQAVASVGIDPQSWVLSEVVWIHPYVCQHLAARLQMGRLWFL